MEFLIETAALQQAVKLLSVTAKTNTSDVAGLILIKANKDSTLEFFSNSSPNCLHLLLKEKVVVKTPGAVSVEFGKVKAFVSSLIPWNEEFGSKEFHFSLDDDGHLIGKTIVSYSTKAASEGVLKLLTQDEYAVRVKSPFDTPSFALNSNVFKEAANKIIYATDPMGPRTFVQGMNLKVEDNKAVFTGTSGRVLSEFRFSAEITVPDGNFIFKHDFVLNGRRAFPSNTTIEFEIKNEGTEREVRARFTDSGVLATLYGQTIIGHEYPQYEHLFEKYTNEIVLDKEMLMNSFLPAREILNADDNLRLTFEIKDGNILFYNDFVNFKYLPKIDFKDNFIIDVNGSFMLQTIEAIQDDKITIRFSDEDNVLLFDSFNFGNQRALVTPLRRRSDG
jgi:DNA polymerase III sliding clamp (beta) subunit (PCNA family)